MHSFGIVEGGQNGILALTSVSPLIQRKERRVDRAFQTGFSQGTKKKSGVECNVGVEIV